MFNEIEHTDLRARSFVHPTSRYYDADVIKYGPDKKITFPIYKKKRATFAPEDQYLEITKEYEFRPDLVSHTFFSSPDFWWRIMEMNGMKDILEFRSGRNIRLPGSALLF